LNNIRIEMKVLDLITVFLKKYVIVLINMSIQIRAEQITRATDSGRKILSGTNIACKL